MSAPVVNLTKLRIRVTRADLRDGEPFQCAACPVALAIERAVVQRVKIDRRRVMVSVGDASAGIDLLGIGDFAADLPAEVENLIFDFDHGYPVRPQTFSVTFEPEPWEDEP